MRGTAALSAVILAADAEAQLYNAPCKITLDGDALRFGRVTDELPGPPVASVYPDGRVDLFHSSFPQEVQFDV